MTGTFSVPACWRILCALGFSCGLALSAAPAPGHSSHGQAFDEGPRQAAYLMEGVGEIDFPITTSVPQAQAFFNQGVGQLHGFWYFEAERSFRQAAMLDPGCAMAYWGMAMANLENPERARGFIRAAVERQPGVSPREALWIGALDHYWAEDGLTDAGRRGRLVADMRRLARRFPADDEAKAFLAFFIWDNSLHDIPIGDYEAVNSLIDQVLAAHPMHPAHHYKIHLWDEKDPNRALDSVPKCGPSAPAIAHMWHMAGHVLTKLHRYPETAWYQEVATRVDHAYLARDQVLPDQIHNYTHNLEWFARSLSMVGRARDAVAVARNLVEIPRHPVINDFEVRESSARYGRTRLVEVLIRYELWEELIELAESGLLDPTDNSYRQFQRVEALSLAYLNLGQTERGVELAGVIKSTLRHEADRRREELEAADSDEARERVKQSHDSKLNTMAEALNELYGYASLNSGDLEKSRRLFDKPTDIEPERKAEILWRLGEGDKALALAESAAREKPNEVLPLATLVDLLMKAGRRTDAEYQFAELRSVAGEADLEVPILKRLAPLAADLGLPKDWRLPNPEVADLNRQFDRESFGPLFWRPHRAADWTLAIASGEKVSLRDYAGRPVILLFYLGHGCVHCIEQLNTFGPMAAKFREAGIEMVAIGSDTPEGLVQTSLQATFGEGFPFPVLADPELAAFHRYRAFDDFEDVPLHGTFLVDGEGLVRWQDISAEPFTDAEFLLGEAKRLLSLPRQITPAE